MPFDGLFMRRVVDEINSEIEGPLRNVYQPTKVDYFLYFQDGIVRISLNPSHSFMSIVERTGDNPAMPPSFTMLLRKKLKNARFEGVSQDGFSRIAVFRFKKMDEKGDLVTYRLFVELMGKHSNLILVDQSDVIVDSHRRIITRLGRELMPGREFVPFRSLKNDPMSFDFDSFNGDSEDPVERYLVRKVEGLSTVLAREICYRAGVMDKTVRELSEKDVERLRSAIEDFKEEYSLGKSYLLVEGETPRDISPIELRHTNLRHLEGKPSRVVNDLYYFLENEEKKVQMRRFLEKHVVQEIERTEDILEKIERDLEKARGYEIYRKWGELLLAYSYSLDGNEESVELEDWETGEKVKVKIDRRKGVVGTAQEYFRVYEKLKRKIKALISRKEELLKELEYLYQLWQTVLDAEDVETLEEIKAEMIEAGLLKSKKVERRVARRSKPRRVEYGGFTILVGKNNVQNDELVREASTEDLWFHARGMPGAHVILKTGGREVPRDVLEYAASLAAGYSRGKDSGKVPVDYTKVRYVRKRKGFKPGMVVYRNQRTIVVEPRRIQ